MENWRVAIVGDGGVGKTALAVRTYDPTIEDAYRKEWNVDDQPCFIDLLDTPGQGEYRASYSASLRKIDAFVLAYAIDSRATFDELPTHLRAIRAQQESPIFIIVGNKEDLAHNRDVLLSQVEEYVEKAQCLYFETSAKTGRNVEAVFTTIVRALRGRRAAHLPLGSTNRRQSRCVIS